MHFVWAERRLTVKPPNKNSNQKYRPQRWETKSNLFMHQSQNIDEGRSLEIVKALPVDPQLFSECDLIDAFAKLSTGPISDEALLHNNFNSLADAARLIAPQLSATQIVHIFSLMCRAVIPMFDELTVFIVHDLLQRSSFMTIDDIIKVDSTLRTYYKRQYKLSQLCEELRQVTQTAFIVRVNDALSTEMDYKILMKIMGYLSNNRSLVKNIDFHRLAEQLLRIDDHHFEFHDVVCTIVTLARVPQLEQQSKQLLSKLFWIWSTNVKDIDDVQDILNLLRTKKLDGIDLTPFQNAIFIDQCVKLATECRCLGTVINILNEFVKLVGWNWMS